MPPFNPSRIKKSNNQFTTHEKMKKKKPPTPPFLYFTIKTLIKHSNNKTINKKGFFIKKNPHPTSPF